MKMQPSYKMRSRRDPFQVNVFIGGLTAIADQMNHKRFFERLALQTFQKISWFGFERKAL